MLEGEQGPNAAEVLGEIARIARDELAIERVLCATDELEGDLELDSMGLTTLVVGLEDTYRMKLTHDDAEGIVTVGDLATMVARRLGKGER